MKPEIRADFREIGRKLTALEIIFSAPLWPKREMLSEAGRTLHDRILEDAKPYALLVADEQWDEALAMAATWSAPAQAFMEDTLINDPNAMVRMANRRLLAVYKHYIDAARVGLRVLA